MYINSALFNDPNKIVFVPLRWKAKGCSTCFICSK